jgi:hypothetical protein
MNEVTTVERGSSAIASTENFITKLALNEKIDEQKLRVLWEIQKDVLAEKRKEEAEAARVAYYSAKAVMQSNLPLIGKSKQGEKGKYAPFEDIWSKCMPIWTAEGFSVAFQSRSVENGLIRVSLILSHKQGHIEVFDAPDAPPDNAGAKGAVNKTPIQANQSTVSYIKRGLLCSVLGIATADEDKDGDRVDHEDKKEWRQDSRSMRDYVDNNGLNRKKAPEPKPEPEYTTAEGTWIGNVERALINAESDPKRIDLLKAAFERAADADAARAVKSLPIVSRLASVPDNLTRINVFVADARKRLGVGEKPPPPPQEPPTSGTFMADIEDPDSEEPLAGPFMDELEWAECFLGYWEALAPKEAKEFMRHHAKTIERARRNPEAKRALEKIRTLNAA